MLSTYGQGRDMYRSLLIGLAGVGISVAAQCAPMNIFVAPYTKIDELLEHPADIYLSGEIDNDTPANMLGIIAAQEAFGRSIRVTFNSPGGNLLAGMQVGRILRDAAAAVSIGTYAKNPKTGLTDPSSPGVCLSACALAFLGGTNRWIPEGSVYGVHRFHSPTGSKSSDLDTAQIISAAIGNYIREMGVAPALFDLMVQAGAKDIYPLNTKQLADLNVVNNGRSAAEWVLDVADGVTYLRGSQMTYYGLGKSVFACADRGFVVYGAHYTAGDKAPFITKGGWYHSLFVDDEIIPLGKPSSLANDNGTVKAAFLLEPALSARIANASRKVGHAMQLSREAPTFVGYNIDLPDEGRRKLKTFLTNCVRGVR